jgi:LDH2 family malate/lactate/ureidoglycolate dehydrogenase
MTPSRWSAAELERWTASVLEAAGAGPEQAGVTAECLADADRRGLDTHGVAILRMFLPRLASEAMDGRAHPRVERESAGSALIDGANGLGPFVARFASDLACRKASEAGAAAVGVRASNHFGAASVHANHCARAGCVAVIVSNSDPGMAPLGALRPVMGTNPLAVSGPAGARADGLSLDMATSVVALGRVRAAARASRRIEPGWAQGADGRATSDPELAMQGSLLPAAGHKGLGLAAAIDVLSGCLTGANVSPVVPGDPEDPRPQNVGHLVIALDVAAFAGMDSYAASFDLLADHLHGAERAPGVPEFMLPGEPEGRRAAERRAGIPLDPGTAGMLTDLGERFGVPFPREEV